MYAARWKQPVWGLFACLTALLFTSTATAEPVQLPDGRQLDRVDFEKHVAGLFGRQGCSAGACHGSFQGKGGLYLSLFGYSPEKDYLSFARSNLGRRINVVDPDQSLILLKATGQVDHGGGMRFDRNSYQYKVIREWIAQGVPWKPGSGAVTRVLVTPKEHRFTKPGESARLKVMVEFADGTQEDMTYFSEFRVNDDYVAEITSSGEVRGLRPGDTSVVVTYRGHVVSGRALVPVAVEKGFQYPKVAEVNAIDREVFAKLRQLNIMPSDLSSDTEFLRRLFIDTIGTVPTPEEVRAFLNDKDPHKRSKKIDEMLAHPMHAALWATKLSDITGNNVDVMEQPANLRPKRAKMWHDWFRKRVAENMPYDQIIKGVLCSTSRDNMPPEDWARQTVTINDQMAKGFDTDYAKRDSLDLFWRRLQGNQFFPLEQMAEHTAAAFMGVRIECAQCHKHPFDRWTQTDYRQYANLFSQVKFVVSPETTSLVNKGIAEQRKAAQDALAAIEKENLERKKEAEGRIDREHAERKKEAEAKLDRDNAERLKAVEAKVANEPVKVRKAAVDEVTKSNADLKRKELAALDKELATKKREALDAVEKENAARRAAAQAKVPPTGNLPQIREVFVSNQQLRSLAHPDTNTPIKPKALGGPEIELQGDAREALWRWLVQADNPYFAHSFVNRVWAHYFGVGIVEPVDDFSVANPPSNEKLLNTLAKDFIDNKFDLRKLEQAILRSRAYQLSALPNPTNVHDRKNYSRAYVRRMMAEVTVDVLNTALGVSENFGNDVPSGCRAIEVAPNRVQNATLTEAFRIFGRPPRSTTCDCERAGEPALPQTLYLMTDTNLLGKFGSGRLSKLLREKKTDEEVLDELFLATLSRYPKQREKDVMLGSLKDKDRQVAFTDILWALINCREFILNH